MVSLSASKQQAGNIQAVIAHMVCTCVEGTCLAPGWRPAIPELLERGMLLCQGLGSLQTCLTAIQDDAGSQSGQPGIPSCQFCLHVLCAACCTRFHSSSGQPSASRTPLLVCGQGLMQLFPRSLLSYASACTDTAKEI